MSDVESPSQLTNAVVKLLQILVTPAAIKDAHEGIKDGHFLTQTFEANICSLLSELNSSDRLSFIASGVVPFASTDVTWQFVEWNLKLLNLLKDSLDSTTSQYDKQVLADSHRSKLSAPSLCKASLSCEAQSTIRKCLQLIVACGMCPSFAPGVGVPLEQRSTCCIFSPSVTESFQSGADRSMGEERLLTCTDTLLDCLSQESLAELILQKHLNDILAALCQLCYRPKCNISVTVRARSRQRLYTLLDFVEPSLVIKELMALLLADKTSQSSTAKQPVWTWLKKACQILLVGRFCSSNGVVSLFRSLIQNSEEGCESSDGRKHVALDWRSCEAATDVLLGCRLGTVPLDEYYKGVALQIIDMLHGNDETRSVYRRLIVTLISGMMSRQPALTETIVMQPLLFPLLSCLEENNENKFSTAASDESILFVTETVLSTCIDDIHNVFVWSSESHSCHLVSALKPITNVLLLLYVQMAEVSHLKTKLEEVIKWYFANLQLPTAMTYLQQLSGLGTDPFGSGLASMHRHLSFTIGSDGGMQVVWRAQREWMDIESTAVGVVNILVLIRRNDDLVARFIIYCIQELTQIISSEVEEVSSDDLLSKAFKLRHHDDDAAASDARRNLTLMFLIREICEKLGDVLLKNSTDIVIFAKATLERVVKVIENTESVEMGASQTDTLTMAMGLVINVVTYETYSSSVDWVETETLIPLLRRLSDKHPDSDVKDIALYLHKIIATHGRVDFDSLTKEQTTGTKFSGVGSVSGNGQDCSTKPKSRLIEEIPGGCSESNLVSKNTSRSDTDSNESLDLDNVLASDLKLPSQLTDDKREWVAISSEHSTVVSQYRQALQELEDPEISTQAAGLIHLRRLIEESDAETMGEVDSVLNIVRKHLEHNNAYIYSNAILTLAALGNRRPALVLASVGYEYAAGVEYSGSRTLTPELRMKVGEVLVLMTTTLGELVPSYRNQLLNCVMSVAKDSDSLLRSSAVSNLGEICRHLRYSLGTVLYEVFRCIEERLKSDTDLIVRRAAAIFPFRLLQGLGKDTFKVMGPLMPEFYRLLKATRYDQDDVVRLHIQLALEELKVIVIDFTAPQKKLTKKIHILDPLDELE